MSHVPHQLIADFPDLADDIRTLQAEDAHFAKLADSYHEINQKVHLAGTNVSPMEQLAEDALRKERAALKDQLYAMLRKTTA
ncbi:YdcH family protein [Sagittula sp. SSi028]|uniref:YdcH family protein n=1 Tax=Sagittula sp. SSi028 TaxID=3400636 RepID=UPI003AF9F43E